MSDMIPITVTVNGAVYERSVEPRLLLSDFLRHELELTGTHVGCEHGVCGACTILFDGEPVRSCLMFAVQAHGQEIMTVEGLAPDGPDHMHPLQNGVSGSARPAMRLLHAGLLDDPATLPGTKPQSLPRPRSGKRSPATSAAAPAISTSSTRCK